MKKQFILLLLTVCLTGCGQSADIGIIGGADGPTEIVVGTKTETEKLTEMPEIPGIPALPGTFAEGWKATDDGMIYVKTIAVSESVYRRYVDETMQVAGYTVLEPEIVEDVTDDRIDAVLCDGEEYSIQLMYTQKEETLTVTITPKA